MAVCSFAHCEAALSLQAAYSDYQIGAFENFHQPVEDTLMVLWPGPKVVFQYELRFVNRLRSQLLISHLFLPIKQMPPKEEEARNQAAFWKYPHFFELSDQFLFQCEAAAAKIAAIFSESIHGRLVAVNRPKKLLQLWRLRHQRCELAHEFVHRPSVLLGCTDIGTFKWPRAS
jgi:hypothetical protein